MAKTGDYKIPFDRSGNQLHYAWQNSRDIEWVDNFKFRDNLRISAMRSGRSAKYTIWRDNRGHTYTMFVSDLIEMMKKCTAQNGSVVGSWTFVKRGQNYGLKYLG